jgi:hypothetical protein
VFQVLGPPVIVTGCCVRDFIPSFTYLINLYFFCKAPAQSRGGKKKYFNKE